MEILHLPAVKGMKWAKMNTETNLLEFFYCVNSGYYKAEDYTQVTDEFVNQYIKEKYIELNYPKIDSSLMPPGYEPTNGIDPRDPNAHLVID